MIVGNYIDQCFVDWTNEHDATPSITGGWAFSSVTCTANQFTNIGAASSSVFFQIKPHGTGHFLNNVTISHNVFKISGGPNLDRVELLDDSIAGLDPSRCRNVFVEGNSYIGVDNPMMNPVTLEMERTSTSNTWSLDLTRFMPFEQHARYVTSVVPIGAITDSSNDKVYDLPYALTEKGGDGQSIELKWSTAVKGKVRVTVRCDDTI